MQGRTTPLPFVIGARDPLKASLVNVKWSLPRICQNKLSEYQLGHACLVTGRTGSDDNGDQCQQTCSADLGITWRSAVSASSGAAPPGAQYCKSPGHHTGAVPLGSPVPCCRADSCRGSVHQVHPHCAQTLMPQTCLHCCLHSNATYL